MPPVKHPNKLQRCPFQMICCDYYGVWWPLTLPIGTLWNGVRLTLCMWGHLALSWGRVKTCRVSGSRRSLVTSQRIFAFQFNIYLLYRNLPLKTIDDYMWKSHTICIWAIWLTVHSSTTTLPRATISRACEQYRSWYFTPMIYIYTRWFIGGVEDTTPPSWNSPTIIIKYFGSYRNAFFLMSTFVFATFIQFTDTLKGYF